MIALAHIAPIPEETRQVQQQHMTIFWADVRSIA